MTSDPDPVDAGPSSSTGPARPGGLVLQPFRALRYTTPADQLALVTSPPYDVLDDAGVAALEQLSPWNVVRLILPRGAGGPLDRYRRAARSFRQWRTGGVLRQDPRPALYVYEQAVPDGGHVQRGLVGALALTPAEDGVVLPHEDTMRGPVADRLALYDAVRADLEPILLVHAGGPGAARDAVQGCDDEVPLLDVVLPDGLRHRVWALTDPALQEAVAADLRPRRALIADGHHRYASHLQRQAAARAAGAGPGPWDAGLALLVDAGTTGPEVRAIHRVVRGKDAADLARHAAAGATVTDLDGRDLDDALDALRRAGSSGPAFLLVSGDGATLRLVTRPDADRAGAALPAGRSAAWRSLDVTLLHHYLVPVLWGLPDDVDAVSFAHDVTAALDQAASTGGTAVLLNPPPVEAVTAVAAAGERMPRKSTLFTPKPRTGLLLRAYDDDPVPAA